MRAPLRRLAATAARPVGAALDRRFEALERRLLERIDRLEERVAVDAAVIAELTSVQRRLIERVEQRVADLETAPGRDGGPVNVPGSDPSQAR